MILDDAPIDHLNRSEQATNMPSRAAEAENAGRLGPPVIQYARGSTRTSVSSVGSDMGFENGGGLRGASRERGGERGEEPHSTRASSGIFPDP